MKIYFVVSDTHSFYTIMKNTLIDNGWEDNNPNHILIVCGDAFDRGDESVEMLEFLYNLYKNDRLVYIRGNHEDLMNEMIKDLEQCVYINPIHIINGTYKTWEAIFKNQDLVKKYYELQRHTVDYYELGKYIFVHGWIPYKGSLIEPIYDKNWKKGDWKHARWENGMEMWHKGIKVPHKTLVCGHWHTGFGHKNLHKSCESEYDNFDIFKDRGIISLDACTAYSDKVNVLVIKESDI